MPRRKNKSYNKPPPLDPNLVSNFHDLVLNGDYNQVNTQLASTPRLANAKDARGFTPLMEAVSSENLSSGIQVQLIDSLMQGGAALDTRNPERCHVLLLACERGAEPEVIDRLLYWNSKRRGVLKWSHCNSDKDGALVLAARSGSLALLSHLLCLEDLDPSCDSNAPIKVIEAAIHAGNERMVLIALGNKRFKDEMDDLEEADGDYGHFDDYSDYYETTPVRSIFVDDCVQAAYEKKMYEAVCAMESLDPNVPVVIWLCWRKSMLQLQAQGSNVSKSEVVSVAADSEAEVTSQAKSGNESESEAIPPTIEAIARKCRGNLVHKHNPALLPILMARWRLDKTNVNTNHQPGTSLDPPHIVLQVPDVIFRHIAPYCFTLCSDALQKEVEYDIFFQKNAEYCCDCEGWFLPFECSCCAYNGYSS